MNLEEARPFQLSDAVDEEPQMLMTSMIDVIFIVLAFFVCVTEIKKGTLNVDVPEVPQVSQDSPSDSEPLIIEVTSDDEIYVGGQPAHDDQGLTQLIGEAVALHGTEVPVHVSGDRDARNGTMMRVVSHLSAAGLKKIVFAVEAGG